MNTHYRKLHSPKRLRKAWQVVYRNGISSKSFITKNEIEEFSIEIERHLARIANQLRKKTFKFSPSHGIAIPKQSNPKKKRPIVVSPVENKILQRAILEAVVDIPEIKQKLNSKYNYGGVEDAGVPKAVKAAFEAMCQKGYFIRTDIAAFFDNVPRNKALNIIFNVCDDTDFNKMLREATDTELDNIAKLGRDSELFPLEDIGVAQGSCLSPMICNLLLHDFDVEMNQKGIICIRYIDDFILFAKDESAAFKAFATAQRLLHELGLEVYDPRTKADKAEHGLTKNGFQFLGCHIRPNRVRPSDSSVRKFKERVKGIFKESLLALKDPLKAVLQGNSYKDTLTKLSNTIRGWGNTYSFCSDDHLMLNIDKDIDILIAEFNQNYRRRLSTLSASDKRRMNGVFLLSDCNKEDEKKSGTIRNQIKLATGLH